MSTFRKYKTIEFELTQGCGTLWFNRPEVRNGFNEAMIGEINHLLDSLKDEKSLEFLIIRGRGKSYSAGADLNWLGGVKDYSFEQNLNESMAISECFSKIYSFPKPTLCLAHGASIGGANGFLAACDFAFCTDDTVFSLSEVKIGVVPSCISPYIFKRVGESKTKELMLSGKRFKGKEAEEMKLVNKSVEENQLELQLEKTIDELRKNGRQAMQACKELIYTVCNKKMNPNERIEYTYNQIAQLRASEEAQEGLGAFLEKRRPSWQQSLNESKHE